MTPDGTLQRGGGGRVMTVRILLWKDIPTLSSYQHLPHVSVIGETGFPINYCKAPSSSLLMSDVLYFYQCFSAGADFACKGTFSNV